MANNIQITQGQLSDEAELFGLYKKVVQVPGGIIRTPEEISPNYVLDFLSKSMMGSWERFMLMYLIFSHSSIFFRI
ncbi:MAG: hypothetical protein AAF363_20730 [Bacteroidota bacterium]